MWWNKKNICAYWDCDNKALKDDFLCADHHEKWLIGLIDRCPKCRRFKDVMYYMCQDCYFGLKVKSKKAPSVTPEPEKQYRVRYSDEWTDASQSIDRRYVYIIGFDDGHLSVGHTRDMRSRLSELKKSQKSAVEQNPRLDYLEVAADEKAAQLRVMELEKLMKSNPEQIGAMTLEFHHQMHEFGFEKD